MGIALTEDQVALAESVAKFAARHAPASAHPPGARERSGRAARPGGMP